MDKTITDKKPYTPFASIYLRGRELEPEKITKSLGINPTRGYKRGEKRGKKNVWPHGIWMLDSSGKLDSDDPIKHIEWLVEILEPARMKLIEIALDENIDAEICVFWIMSSSHEVLTITPNWFQRIASFNIRLELSIYSNE